MLASEIQKSGFLQLDSAPLTRLRLVQSILGLGSMGNVCYKNSKIKLSPTGYSYGQINEWPGKEGMCIVKVYTVHEKPAAHQRDATAIKDNLEFR